jgi:uncharacterized BrkB/YihY/UPF0761 family membrane protein
MLKLQWGLIGVLAFGGIGHLAGTLMSYPPGTYIFVWSLTAVFHVFAAVFLQALRLTRENDRWIRAGATVATAAWMLLALAFGLRLATSSIPAGWFTPVLRLPS